MLGVPNFDRTANNGSAAERLEQEWRGMAPHLYTVIEYFDTFNHNDRAVFCIPCGTL